ncbi:hypothetical protein P148_SR1C00001G0543 [candidate division SR1 bacterium RAAC1_SR1_1]|nr:hypothetical protein P148_SR1C00001G0543 [candidate division SR1 bacterium RAAC1_SR1_1]
MKIESYVSSQLNEEQSKAALHINTSSLIIAGAGSGKTRTLTYKIAYLIFGKQIHHNKILAVTFTNKAAAEMKERLVKIAQDLQSKGSNATSESEIMTNSSGDGIDDFLNTIQSSTPSQPRILDGNSFKWIGTFHSIFLKMLKEDIEKLDMKYTKNFGIFDTNESQSVIKDVLKQLGMVDIFKPQEVKSFISTQKNNGFDPKMFSKQANSDYDHNMYTIYQKYQEALELANSLDFDDLLLLPYLLFKKQPEVLQKWQKQFSYILVDEAQDTNWIQFELMKMLSGESANITLIGDDFQSIYGWRGALMENFLNVKKYWPDIQMFKLQTNYRSRPHIVDAGNQVIKNNTNQYQKDIVAHRTGSDKIVCFSHGSEMDEAANIIDFIKKMKDTDKIKERGQIAILYRTNAQSSPFEQIFLQEGIPYKIFGAFKFFERKEVKDILSYIKYIINPQDSVSLKRILNVPERGIGKTSIDRLSEYASTHSMSIHNSLEQLHTDIVKLTPKAKSGLDQFVRVMHDLRNKLPSLAPAQFIDLMVKAIKYRDYLVKEEGGESQADEKYENIGQIINMAEKYQQTGDEALRQFMEEVALLSDIAENSNGNLDAVKLMTVHSSKGLEFPFVFIVGLEDHVFPLSNSLMDTKLLEEERRLMYVAITRAEDHLFFSYANSRMTRGQTKMNPPSRFLDEISVDLMKKYDLGGGSSFAEDESKVNEGDIVKHKLFGTGYVLEVWKGLAIVKFHNPKFGVRKIEQRFLQVM